MKNMMIISSYSAPYGGNFISSLMVLEEKLKNIGINSIYIFPKEAYNHTWCKNLSLTKEVIFIDLPKGFIDISLIKKLKQIIVDKDIDIVYSHFTGYDLSCYFAIGQSQKLILHMHNPINNKDKISNYKRIKENIKYRLYNSKCYIITCAEHLKDFIVQHGFNENKCTYVLNGVDIQRIYSNMNSKSRIKKTNKKIILMHGWDPYRKGVDIALKAVEECEEDNLLYITYVNKEIIDQFFYDNYNGKIPKNVVLIPAIENIMEYLKECDIFISPSRAEGSPYALMEAIVAGIPSIGTDLPGLEWQNDIPCLFTVNPNCSNELLEAINYINNLNDEEKEKLIDISRDIIIREHSTDSWANSVASYINSIV